MMSEADAKATEVNTQEEGTSAAPGVENAGTQTTSTNAIRTLAERAKNIKIDKQTMGPYIGQFLAALILLLAVNFDPDPTNYTYGVIAMTVAIVGSLMGLYLLYGTEKGTNVVFTAPGLGDVTVQSGNAIFLFIWWVAATGTLTFSGPFLETSNGYLAAWTGLVMSVSGLSNHFETINMGLDGDELYSNGLIVASLILIGALPSFIFESPEAAYALILSILTGIFVTLPYTKSNDKLKQGLAILWVISACLVTFRGPFIYTGNGYFAAWGGMFFAVKLAVPKENTEELTEERNEESTMV